MSKYKVLVTRDASVTFQAIVEANNINEIKDNFGKHGYEGEIISTWLRTDISEYDHVDYYQIAEMDDTIILISDP